MIDTVKIGSLSMKVVEVDTLHATSANGKYRKLDGSISMGYGKIELDAALIPNAKCFCMRSCTAF